MKHYGDIKSLSGYDLEIVDVITGGSPCQDLSVAGKRAGLNGERSGLFMEQIRIIKEMRAHDRSNGRAVQFVRPRYMVWENVPGAFSSGNPKGADFQAVLEETTKIVCREAPTVPIPKDGWPQAGCISGVGDSGVPFSIAWRVHDAQFWGVPQRRKRIALVADFGGLTAPEVLFERKGLLGYSESCGEERQETAGSTGTGIAESGLPVGFKPRESSRARGIGFQTECSPTVSTDMNEAILLESNQNHATIQTDGVCTALPASMGMGGGYVPMITESAERTFCIQGGGETSQTSHGSGINEEVSFTVNALDRHAVARAVTMCPRQQSMVCSEEVAATLGADDYKEPQMVLPVGADMYNGNLTGDIAATLNATSCDSPTHSGPSVVYEMQHASEVIRETRGGVSPTLQSRMGTGGNNIPLVMENNE